MPIPTLSAPKAKLPGRADSLIPELIRQLVNHADGAGANTRPADDVAHPTEEVVIDLNVDGTRYLLLKLPQVSRPRSVLSPREHEIVRMVSHGHSNKIIADVLGISAWTVCTHMRRIFAKLGVTSRAAMVARLLESATAEHAVSSSMR